MKSKKTILFLLVILTLNIFAIDTPFGVGPSIFLVVLVTTVCGFFADRKNKILSLLLAVFASFLAIMPSITANHFLRSLDLWMYFGSLYLIILINGLDFVKDNLFWWIVTAVKSLPTFFFVKKRSQQIDAIDNSAEEKSRKKVQIIASTSVITLVVLIVFGSLLASADPVFSKLIEDFFETFLERLVISALIAGFLLLITVFRHKPQDSEYSCQKIQTLSALIASSSLIALFGLFIFVQIKYLFANEATFKALDITYSDYVRAGFTQLLWVGALGLILSYFLHIRSRITAQLNHVSWLKSANAILVIELFVILLSAAKRNSMYISAYGLTRIRWVGGVFLFWLAAIFCLMAILVLVKKFSDRYFISGFLGLGMIAVLFLNLINMDRVIANYQPSDDFKQIDYYYLSLLSEDVVDVWFRVVPDMERDINRLTSKSGLVDDEKKQLAAIKLALFNMDYKVNQLIIKYTTDEKMLTQAVCHLQYLNNPLFSEPFDHCLLWMEKDSQSIRESDHWKEEYDQNRKWQAFNAAEYQAFNLLTNFSSTEDESISRDYQVFSKLMGKIMVYQDQADLRFWNEIHWRKNNFEAPMVNREPYYNFDFEQSSDFRNSR